MKSVVNRTIKKVSYTPENVGGGCMTGRVMSDTEAKKVSSFIAQYKTKKRAPASTKKPKL
ncbi:MAG TPA: hypothetical protein VGM30_12075 [Puia sp.]|jgi:hypothetical protein